MHGQEVGFSRRRVTRCARCACCGAVVVNVLLGFIIFYLVQWELYITLTEMVGFRLGACCAAHAAPCHDAVLGWLGMKPRNKQVDTTGCCIIPHLQLPPLYSAGVGADLENLCRPAAQHRGAAPGGQRTYPLPRPSLPQQAVPQARCPLAVAEQALKLPLVLRGRHKTLALPLLSV